MAVLRRPPGLRSPRLHFAATILHKSFKTGHFIKPEIANEALKSDPAYEVGPLVESVARLESLHEILL